MILLVGGLAWDRLFNGICISAINSYRVALTVTDVRAHYVTRFEKKSIMY